MALSPSFFKQLNSNPGDLTKKKGLSNALGQQYAIKQMQIGDTEGKRANEYGHLYGDYTTMAQGGTPSENSALEQSLLTPIAGQFNTARDMAAGHVARTGNSAGYSSLLGDLARSQGREAGQAGLAVANEKYNRKLQGLEGIAQLYGIDTSFLNSLMGHQGQIVGMGNDVEARRKGILGTIGSALGIGGAIGKGIAGAF